MRILLDGCVPRPLRRFLAGHDVQAAPELGWGQLKNGDLLKAADLQFDVFVTADQNIRYQQNLKGRQIAIVVVPTNDWTVLRTMTERINAALSGLKSGDYLEISKP